MASQTVKLQQKLPIYITYFTAWPDDTGKIQYFNDIYERDQVIERALQPAPAAPQQLSQTN